MGRSNPAGTSSIKRIQRGYHQCTDSGSHGSLQTETISISAVDQTKSFIYASRSTANAFGYGQWQNTLFSESLSQHPKVYFSADDEITVAVQKYNFSNGYKRAYVGWQVIEYV